MSNFIPPVTGSKIGEFNISRSKLFIYDFNGMIYSLFIFIWSNIVLIVLPISLGGVFMRFPFNPEWLSWIIAIVLCLFGGFVLFMRIYLFFNDTYKRKAEDIYGRSLSLFLVNNGVEINDKFIPFKDRDLTSPNFSADGIVLFKIDGDYLYIKTEGDSFISFYDSLNENEMKFKLEEKYIPFKEELLVYLNSLIVKE